jgi:predicted RNA-binding Zn ribbon-like protein
MSSISNVEKPLRGDEAVFEFSGGRLCLDFANTVIWRGARQPTERLKGYGDLLAWSQQAGLVTGPDARALVREAARHPAAAAAVFERAIALREAIYRIFSAIAGARSPEADDVATVNATLAEAMGRSRLAWTAKGFVWDWPADTNALDRVLWRLARSTADLVVSTDVAAVRQCAADPCRWLFLDTTRNRRRRWCDMRVCGNRVKARRYYQRQRASL